MSVQDDGYRFEISADHPALDFVNTVSRRSDPANNLERLTAYGRLVSWGEQMEFVTPREAEKLRSAGAAHPRAAAAAVRRAVELREALFVVFDAAAHGRRPPASALEAVNAALPEALAALRVDHERGVYAWRFTHRDAELAPMLAPVLRAAADLLTSDDLARVRVCDSETCFWLFLDRSKNGSRRWCDMKICGNREKARRHYAREKAAAGVNPRDA
jgi:predicted RNA-binding Zn ribbon-like protein